jgi:FkbM family methyltransferase
MSAQREHLEILLAETADAARLREQTAIDELSHPFEGRFVLFGAGKIGLRTLAGLRRIGIEPLAFADNDQSLWGRLVDGVAVLSPAEAAQEFGDRAAFLVTILQGRAVDCVADRIRQLTSLGCKKVLHAGFLYWKFPDIFLPYYPIDLPHKVLLHKENVRRVFDLWEDEASRREYVAQIRFRLALDFNGMGNPFLDGPYVSELFYPSHREVFVDCGAFDGDTVRSFLRCKGGQFARVIAFEPDPANSQRLRETVEALPEPTRRKIEVVSCALGASKGTVMFNSTGTDTAAVGPGCFAVACITLDDALQNQRATIIKFDIEGAELDALRGGSKVIARDLPVLTVSAYHEQSHLWEVPLAITSISRHYQYFLRPHGSEGWDLMCYAIPPERVAINNSRAASPAVA